MGPIYEYEKVNLYKVIECDFVDSSVYGANGDK